MEAEILKGYLESREIKVFLKGEAAGQLYGLSSGPLAQVELFVPSEQFDLALGILEEYQNNAD